MTAPTVDGDPTLAPEQTDGEGPVVGGDGLPYGPRLTCQQPPLLRTPTDVDDVSIALPHGFQWMCPDVDCGAVWAVQAFRNWGGINDVRWDLLDAPPPATTEEST